MMLSLSRTVVVFLCLASSHALSGSTSSTGQLRAVFSDIDGTLVHYAKDFEKYGVKIVEQNEQAGTAVVEDENGERRNCRLLPSLTMGPACISERTIELVSQLRQTGILFGVVTAARKSTMLTRWPLLPECDIHVCETGSRVWVGGKLDLEFSSRLTKTCGPIDRDIVGEDTRDEPLWQFYRQLRDEVPGLTLDSKSYYGMFRASTREDTAVEAALQGRIESTLPSDIAWAMNLGKYDFYPKAAGKGNVVSYLQDKFQISKEETACLFDDDNDLCMAEQCGTHWLPGLTSRSVEFEAASHPSWHVATKAGQGVFAIEECLEALLYRAKLEHQQEEKQLQQEIMKNIKVVKERTA